MQGEDVLVKRTTLEKYSQGYYPVFKNEGGKRYIIAYDPSSRADNSVIMVAELFRDEERGLMLKIVNCQVLVEVMKDGSKQIIQKPEQVEILKGMMLDYNAGFQDYEALEEGGILIDGGAGG